MAPIQQVTRPEKEKRVDGILGFASELESKLSVAIATGTGQKLADETENQIALFPSRTISSAASKFETFDSLGTSLWNHCTRLRRQFETETPENVPQVLLVARVFAFLLLDCGLINGKNVAGNLRRLMRIGIKAGRSCLQHKDLHLALRVLARMSAYEEMLTAAEVSVSNDDKEGCVLLVAEYYVLRTALAWYQGDLKVCDHMFQKAISSQQIFDAHTSENLADVLYEMGKDLLAKQDFKLAVEWLDRAYDILTRQELERLSLDASELRTSIIQSTVKSLLGMNQPKQIERARSLVDLLESEIGGKLIVSLLKLEVISASAIDSFDSISYSDVLNKMTRTLILSDDNFRLLMFHIRKLNDKSPSLACKALDDLVGLRILKDGKHEWIEKALVTRIYITIGQRDCVDAMKRLKEFLNLIISNSSEPVSSEASLGAQTLLWKRIEANYCQGQYNMADNWCRLAIHPIFAKSGESNMARISRKLLLCALNQQDIRSAREIFAAMPDATKNEPMTRFLMYKIAVRAGELELVAECLQKISTSSSADPTLLFACCLDAQSAGDKVQTLDALQLVLEKHGHCFPGTVHLPSLIRTTISLMVAVIEESKTSDGTVNEEATIEKLCKIFERAVENLRKSHNSAPAQEPIWTLLELEWFSKNSYNLAIKNTSLWNPLQTKRLLTCCVLFIDGYPKDTSKQVSEDLALRKMFCEFTISTALIVLARSDDNIESQLQYYLNLRKHVESYDSLLQAKLEKIEDVSAQDLLQKLSILVTFDFEAACHLKAWNDLGEIVLRAELCKSMRVYQVMADCLLSCQPPTPVLIQNMKRIINEAWGLEAFNLTRLAKYMRCLFQVAISDNSGIAEELLDQVQSHAEEAIKTDTPYPDEELEWIATTAFNHAVDLYCANQDEASKIWSNKALNIAHFCADDGNLEKVLQGKLLHLKFDS